MDKRKSALVFILVLGLIGSTSAFAGGDGSESNPYQIDTCQHLEDVKNDLDANYTLISDIDCSNLNTFDPIGHGSNEFTGILNGQDYTISNIVINSSYSEVGIIGDLSQQGEVKNLIINNLSMSSESSYPKYSGSVIGIMVENSNVKNIIVNNSEIKITNTSNSAYGAGGIVGTYSSGNITNTVATNIKFDIQGNQVENDNPRAGGIIGVGRLSSSGNTRIKNVYADVVSTNDLSVTGSLIGWAEYCYFGCSTTRIYDAYSKSELDINISASVTNTEGEIIDIYFDKSITPSTSSHNNITGLTTSEMQGSSSSTNMDFDFVNNWETVESSDSDSSEDGYPILSSLPRSEQLKLQGVYQTTPISNLNIDNPSAGDTFTYEQASNGIQVDWSWDNPAGGSVTSDLFINGVNTYTNTNSGTSDTTTISKSEFDVGSSTNNISVTIDDGTNTLNQEINITVQNPQHAVTSVSSPNPSVDMDLGSGVDIVTDADFDVEAGEQVIISAGTIGERSGNTYTCNSGICNPSLSETRNVGPGTYTLEAKVEGQDSGFTDTQTGSDITVYNPSLTYNGPTDGSTVSYSSRDQTLDYTWDSSNQESVTAHLYYNGNKIRTDNLSPGQSITESVTGDLGQNNWYVEVTGDTSGDTETFATQSFTVNSPSNSVSLNSPANNSDFDSGIVDVGLIYDYSVEEDGNIFVYLDGTQVDTFSASEGDSGTGNTLVPVDDGNSYDWNVTFEGTTGVSDVTSPTRSFEVLPKLATGSLTSPTDGQTFSWNNRDVTFNWNAESNEPYTTTLYVDGTQEYQTSFSNRGSNSVSHTMTLGDSTQPVTYDWHIEVTGDNTGESFQSSTNTFTVEDPEISEIATLTSPANNSDFPEFVTVDLEGEVQTNIESEVRVVVDGSTVKTQSVGTSDKTDTVTETITYSDTYNQGIHDWKIEVGSNESETRQFNITDEVLEFNYNNPTDGKVFREGIDEVNYSMNVTHERNGTVSILKEGQSIYSENVSVQTRGKEETNTITYTESVNGNPTSIDWKGQFSPDENSQVFKDADSSSYSVEELPSPVLDSPDDGVYFRNLPETVSHDFNVSDTENEVTSELIVNGKVEKTFTGSGAKSGLIDYLEEDVGKQNWTVNTTWTNDTGVERDTETREYNTGDPDIAEGRAIDSMINYVSNQLGMSYLGAAILINLTLSMLFGIAVMYKTKSVGYTLLTFGTAFFGLGIIGFLPNILIILLGIAAVSVLTIYTWKFTFGDSE